MMDRLNSFYGQAQRVIILAAALLFISFSGCKKDEGDGILSGVIYYDHFLDVDGGIVEITGAYCYVFIDNDTDITNGYAARIVSDILNVTPGTPAINYQVNTADIPAGKYYLMAAYDFEINDDGNTDPDNPMVWEAKGWYGSTTTNPPDAANVSDLSASYDITLHGLAK